MGQPDGEEAWTFVSSKRSRRSGKQRAPPLAGAATSVALQTRTTANLSLEAIRSDHEKFSQQWIESECCRKLKGIIKPKSCSPIPAKAICLGLGSFDPEDGSWQIRRRSHVQLAAFQTLVDCLQDPGAPKIRCIFQEPCFVDGDKKFLESLGYEILDSPGGFEEVSEDSIVFGIHLYRDIYSAAIDKAMPAMFIGTGYDVWESYADAKAPIWEKMRLLHDSCDKLSFPDDKDFYPTFTNTTIHWRRTNSDDLADLSTAVESLSIDNSTS